MPCTGTEISCMTLVIIDMEPTYKSPPYSFSPLLSVTSTRLSVLCMINGEIPRDAICFITGRQYLIFFLLRRILLFSDTRNLTTHAELTACEIIVASAAPRTPISKTKINIGSSTILISAPISTDNMAVFASP